MGMKPIFCRAAYILLFFLASAMADTKTAAEQIRTAPRWGGLDKDSYASRSKEIATHLEEFIHLPVNEAREVIKLALQEKVSASKLGAIVDTLYLANRVYFDIPENVEVKDVKTFGGTYIGGGNVGERKVVWPLVFSKDGTYALEGTYNAYAGPVYDVLGEFDYFSKKYKRRYK